MKTEVNPLSHFKSLVFCYLWHNVFEMFSYLQDTNE